MNNKYYNVLKKAISASCCSSLSRPASSSRVRCTGVREKEVSSVEKNWARVIPNAWQIFSRDGMDGTRFLRYHEEIVDWVRPDSSAS